MKTLYIEGSKTTRVTLDGPSLLVSSPGSAPRRYPLARIARVIVAGNTILETGAIVSVLEAGLPLTFLGAGGQAAGIALPARARQDSINRRIDDFLGRPDWRPLYENWRRAAERAEILAVLRRLRLAVPDLRPASVARLLDARLSALAPPSQSRRMIGYLEGLLAAIVSDQLIARGLDPAILDNRREGFCLPAQMTAILVWQLRPDLAQWLAGGCGSGPDWKRNLTAFHEQRLGRERQRAARLFDSFLYWLGGSR